MNSSLKHSFIIFYYYHLYYSKKNKIQNNAKLKKEFRERTTHKEYYNIIETVIMTALKKQVKCFNSKHSSRVN